MILVTGATGSIGKHVTGVLGATHTAFRAMVREADKGRELGCDFVVADFDDPDSLIPAMEGTTSLLLNGPGAAPASGQQPMVRQQIAAIEAARLAGVSRIVKISAWQPSPDAKLSVRAHWEIEQHLQASGVEWSCLRPTGFMQNFFTGEGGFDHNGAISGPYGTGAVAYIDAYDIARCAAVLLTERTGANQSFDVTGPQALTHQEIATKLGVPFHDLSPSQAQQQLRDGGLPDWFVEDLLWLYADMASGGLSEVTTAVRDLTGRAPRTFDEFLATHSM